jgi:hypothetical protein
MFLVGALVAARAAWAETDHMRISHGYSSHYLALMVVRDQHLLEKHASAMGLDKIALPGIKTSFAAVALAMAVAKEFGIESYARLDPLTVGMPHPDAAIALIGGKPEITAHMASPPFSNRELASPNIHRVFDTMDVFPC